MIRKLLLWMVFIIVFLLSMTGCTGKKIKLDYIKTPDTIVIQGYNNRERIQAVMDKMKDLQKKGASREDQEKVHKEISNLISKSTLEIKDKKIIERIIVEISNSEGTIEGPSVMSTGNNLLFLINCVYKDKNYNTPAEINEGYLNHIDVFPDGTTLITRYDAGDNSKIILVKTLLSKDTIKYITDYYNSNL